MDRIFLEGDHKTMGRKLGQYFLDVGSRFPLKLNDDQIKHGEGCMQVLTDYFPEIVDEINSVNEYLSIDPGVYYGILNCMGCCLTIREGHNVEVRGCTAFVIAHNNSIFYGRDNDLPPYLKPVSKSFRYKPEKSNSFILNTSSFINGEEGINESGLLVAMTFVVPLKTEIKQGFTSLFLVRYLLERCANVDQAIKEIKRLPIASSCNILLADKDGRMVVAECNPYRINIRLPETNRAGKKFIVTVNHFTSDKMAKHDGSNRNVYSSRKRYDTAYNSLSAGIDGEPVDFLKSLLKGDKGFMCQYSNKIKFETIWSTLIDINRQQMHLAEGDPRETFYKESRLF